MAFIAIDAKADISGNKKGRMSPAQHAQLNSWCLTDKTGILDWSFKCQATNTSYSVSEGKARVVFKKGYVVICGRLIECEADTYIDIPAPSVGQLSGFIILKVSPSNSGYSECVLTIKTTSALVQQDLNDNPNGTYELELYSYLITPQTCTLTRRSNHTPIVSSVAQSLTLINERLTELGFNEGSVTNVEGIDGNVTLKKLGKFVICAFKYNQMDFHFTIANEDFRPYEDVYTIVPVYTYSQSRYIVAIETLKIASNGIVSGQNQSSQYMEEALPCIIGWSTDENFPIEYPEFDHSF